MVEEHQEGSVRSSSSSIDHRFCCPGGLTVPVKAAIWTHSLTLYQMFVFYWIIQRNTFQFALIILTSVVHAGKEGDQEDVEVVQKSSETI